MASSASHGDDARILLLLGLWATTAAAVPGPREGLPPEVIRRVVYSHLHEIRACYEAALREDGDRMGRVTVSFVIAGDGHVQSATIRDAAFSAPRMERCFLAAVRSWRFPAPEGGGIVGVNYPFILAPG